MFAFFFFFFFFFFFIEFQFFEYACFRNLRTGQLLRNPGYIMVGQEQKSIQELEGIKLCITLWGPSFGLNAYPLRRVHIQQIARRQMMAVKSCFARYNGDYGQGFPSLFENLRNKTIIQFQWHSFSLVRRINNQAFGA